MIACYLHFYYINYSTKNQKLVCYLLVELSSTKITVNLLRSSMV